jgi:glutamate--cysteine ligase
MNMPRFQALQHLSTHEVQIYRGIEKEGLRVTDAGVLAQDTHPLPLGAPLTHPQITTDYSEALLEFVTPVYSNVSDCLTKLQDLHRFTLEHLPNQIIWASSMPCRIDREQDVRIAEFGGSNLGQLKHVYRHGLWHRYGRLMQSIAGVHYNISFGKALLETIAAHDGVAHTKEWQSEQYFHVIRNFRRHQYLLAYLFGASPAFDTSFAVGNTANVPVHGARSRLLPGATSLRMSDVGYSNPIQAEFYVCFNALSSFVNTVHEAMNCSHPDYEAIGIKDETGWKQLNTNVLQIENEYYSDIRPKRVTQRGERPSAALLSRGVEYVEVRCLDLDPFSPVGVSEDQLRFLDLFMLWCLVKKSPLLSRTSCEALRQNQLKTTRSGADGQLELQRYEKTSTIRDWGLETLDRMQPLAEWLESRYPGTKHALQQQQLKLRGELETPCQRITRHLQEGGEDHIQLVHQLSAAHREQALSQPLSEPARTELEQQALESHQAQTALESSDAVDFDTFVKQWSA